MSGFWMGMLVGLIVGTNGGVLLIAALLATKEREDYPLPPQPQPWPKPRPQETEWLIAADALGLDVNGRVASRERAS